MIHSTHVPSSTTRRWSSRRIWKDWTRPRTWSKRRRLRSRTKWRPRAQSGAGRQFAGRAKAEAQRWAAAVGASDGSGRPSVPLARRRRIKQLGASDCQDHRRGPPRVMVIADPRRRLAWHELLAALHLVAYWHFFG